MTIRKQIEFGSTKSFSLGSTCSRCDKNIEGAPQAFTYEDENPIYFCDECALKDDFGEGKDKYCSPKLLMFAHPEAKEGLSETVFYKLSTKELGASNPVHTYVFCDGCG